MALRLDPLPAAAELVLAIEFLCRGRADADGLVCTVGQLTAQPGASNVIAGHVVLSIDVRARRDEVRTIVVQDLRVAAADICRRRGLECSVEVVHEAVSVDCDVKLRLHLEDAVTAVNALHGARAPALTLTSGAGHDALALAEFCPVGMLFVRCLDGVSHSPKEYVSPGDIIAAVQALVHVIRGFGQEGKEDL